MQWRHPPPSRPISSWSTTGIPDPRGRNCGLGAAGIWQTSSVPSGSQSVDPSSWHLSSAWWRGAAAASVIVSSALVVVHLRDEPGVTMQPGARPNADRAAQPSPPAQPAPTLPAAEATTDRLALATPPQSSTAPAPATAPSPAAEAARSAFPGDENQAANATGRAGTADADGAILDATPGPAAAPMAPAPVSGQTRPQRSAPSMPRIDERSGTRSKTLAPAPIPPATSGAAADAVAEVAPPPAHAVRPASPAEQAPRSGLLAAVTAGDIEAARRILPTTDPDAERDPDGRTALAIAVLRSDLPMTKLLLASGANRRAQDRFGQTPAGHAAASGDPVMLGAFGSP